MRGNSGAMANFSKLGILGVLPGPLSLHDGTLIRAVSARPGSLGLPTVTFKPAVADSVSHHDVKRGDSLWSICSDKLGSGLLADDLAKLNGITAATALKPGMRLIVPDFQRDELTVGFMLAEMIRNASGKEAAAISDAIQRSRTMSTGADQASADMT